jgi:hypothetical protein
MSSRRRSKRDAAADNSSDDEDETLLLKGAHADVAFWYKHAEKVGLKFAIFHIVFFFRPLTLIDYIFRVTKLLKSFSI